MHTVDVMLALSSKTSQLISHISVPQMQNEGNKSTQHLKYCRKHSKFTNTEHLE